MNPAMTSLAGFLNPSNIGPTELLIVLAIVLIIFGPKKLPGLGRAIGKSIREFRNGMSGLSSVLDEEDENKPKTPAASSRGDLDPKPASVARDETASSSSQGPASSN